MPNFDPEFSFIPLPPELAGELFRSDFIIEGPSLELSEDVLSGLILLSLMGRELTQIEGNPVQNVYDMVQTTAEYAREEGITDIFFMDGAARPAAHGVKAYWEQMYPDEKRPNLYFLNPMGFVSKEDIWDGKVNLTKPRGVDRMTIQDMSFHEGGARLSTEIDEELRQKFPDVIANGEDQPILLIDTCIHGGSTLGIVKEKFTKNGVKDVRIGVFDATPNHSPIRPDFAIKDGNDRDGRCYPFEMELLVDKTLQSINSVPRREEVDGSVALREVIRDIVVLHASEERQQRLERERRIGSRIKNLLGLKRN